MLLPPEVLLHVLGALDLRHQLRLQRVSRLFQGLCRWAFHHRLQGTPLALYLMLQPSSARTPRSSRRGGPGHGSAGNLSSGLGSQDAPLPLLVTVGEPGCLDARSLPLQCVQVDWVDGVFTFRARCASPTPDGENAVGGPSSRGLEDSYSLAPALRAAMRSRRERQRRADGCCPEVEEAVDGITVSLDKGTLPRSDWTLRCCLAGLLVSAPASSDTATAAQAIAGNSSASLAALTPPTTLVPPYERDDLDSQWTTVTSLESQLTFHLHELPTGHLCFALREFRMSTSYLGALLRRQEGLPVPARRTRHSIFGRARIQLLQERCQQAGLEWRDVFFSFDVVLRWLSRTWPEDEEVSSSAFTAAVDGVVAHLQSHLQFHEAHPRPRSPGRVLPPPSAPLTPPPSLEKRASPTGTPSTSTGAVVALLSAPTTPIGTMTPHLTARAQSDGPTPANSEPPMLPALPSPMRSRAARTLFHDRTSPRTSDLLPSTSPP